MFFYLKRFLGEFLVSINYLAELTVVYRPTKQVHFGRTMRQFERQQRFLRKVRPK